MNVDEPSPHEDSSSVPLTITIPETVSIPKIKPIAQPRVVSASPDGVSQEISCQVMDGDYAKYGHHIPHPCILESQNFGHVFQS